MLISVVQVYNPCKDGQRDYQHSRVVPKPAYGILQHYAVNGSFARMIWLDNTIVMKYLWPWRCRFLFSLTEPQFHRCWVALCCLGSMQESITPNSLSEKEHLVLKNKQTNTDASYTNSLFPFFTVKEKQHIRICLLRQNISDGVKLCKGFT